MEVLLGVLLVAACCGLPLLYIGASALKGKRGEQSEVDTALEGKQPGENSLQRPMQGQKKDKNQV